MYPVDSKCHSDKKLHHLPFAQTWTSSLLTDGIFYILPFLLKEVILFYFSHSILACFNIYIYPGISHNCFISQHHKYVCKFKILFLRSLNFFKPLYWHIYSRKKVLVFIDRQRYKYLWIWVTVKILEKIFFYLIFLKPK